MMEIKKDRGAVYCNGKGWELFDNQVKKLDPTKVFILTDQNTTAHCLPYFIKVTKLENFEHLEMAAGETHKNITTCITLWETLSEKGADRNSLLINLGGGVVTDLGGFVACTFKRGIEFINIPTSLLAMVDASVGGKNGVDLGFLKNQVGVIKNAKQVIIDTHFLKTLPSEHITSGYAEMLKHGIISSETYYNDLKKFDENNFEATATLIWESVMIKNKIVTEDPLEKGLRKTLNYGHTLGHAVESYLLDTKGTTPLLHGNAVAIGIILATYISSELLDFPKQKLTEITKVINSRYEKVAFSKKDIDSIIDLLIYDKKNNDGKVLFVLLRDFAKHKTNCEVPNSLIYKAFEYYKNS